MGLEVLKVELEALTTEDLDFDLQDLGFEIAEIDLLLDPAKPNGNADEDQPPSPEPIAVSRPGDLWCLGDHRLLSAMLAKRQSSTRSWPVNGRRSMFTDPPYNVKIDGHVCGLGAVKHGEFAMAAGEMFRRSGLPASFGARSATLPP